MSTWLKQNSIVNAFQLAVITLHHLLHHSKLLNLTLSMVLFLYDPYFCRTGCQTYRLAITVSAGAQMQASNWNPFISSFLSFLSQWFTPALLYYNFHILFKHITMKMKWKACSGNQIKKSLHSSAEVLSIVSVYTCAHATFTHIGYIILSLHWRILHFINNKN